MKQWGQKADLKTLAKAKRLQRKRLLDEIAEKQEEVEHVEASLAMIRSKSKLASGLSCGVSQRPR